MCTNWKGLLIPQILSDSIIYLNICVNIYVHIHSVYMAHVWAHMCKCVLLVSGNGKPSDITHRQQGPPPATDTHTHTHTHTHTYIAMATAIHSQNPFGSPPTFTFGWLCHNPNKGQTPLTTPPVPLLSSSPPLPPSPHNKPHMELYLVWSVRTTRTMILTQSVWKPEVNTTECLP
jgi:hypothetical protein